MFSNESWLTTRNRASARELYSSILSPQLWEMGTVEGDAIERKRERWTPPESYLFFQPDFRNSL